MAYPNYAGQPDPYPDDEYAEVGYEEAPPVPGGDDFGEQTLVDFPVERSGAGYSLQDFSGQDEGYGAVEEVSEEDIQPTLWIIGDRAVSSLTYSPEQVSVSIGNSQEEVDVYINDPRISKKQLVITRIGYEWMFVDRGVKDLCRFDGIPTRQAIAPWNCRTVIHMGASCLVFTGAESSNFLDANRLRPKRRRLEVIYDPAPTEGCVYLANDKMTVDSIQEPIVIGSHMVCDFIIPEKSVRPFHAMLYWHPEGIFVEPMGNFRIQVNSELIDQPYRLKPDDQIVIGSEALRVTFYGNPLVRCQELFADGLEFENFCLTPLGGVTTEAFYVPAYGGACTIGRSSSCNITLPDLGVSRAHAQIIPSGKSFHLIDNYSANGTYVNNEKVSKARVHAGDVMEIGKTFFLVHYS